MLRRLEIENYGLIAHASVDFADGATIFTGETGSGKTMLLGALDFVLGERADATAVRRGSERAAVTLTFDPGCALRDHLNAEGFAVDPGEEASLAREMSAGGRSAMRINGRPATAAAVRAMSEQIAEIVGQHEAQRLLAPAYHRELLDAFGGQPAQRAAGATADAYANREEAAGALEALLGDERRAHERYDDAAFMVREIEAARPEPDEDVRLRERQRLLDNASRIAEALRRARTALAGDESGATHALGEAASALSSIGAVLPRFAEMAASAAALQSQVHDLVADVAGALESGDEDPRELDALNARLDALERLQRKYGGDLATVLRRADDARAMVDAYEQRDRVESELRLQLERARLAFADAAAALTAVRAKAAVRLGRAVRAEFADLALGGAAFRVELEPLDLPGLHGAERVAFLFSANATEPERALARVASGGERSRLLLALIVALAAVRGDASALVFDEIDSGIGGATGTAVGARIGRLARDGQVVCVTHLAQLAAWAGRHYVLEKVGTKNDTVISVREIAAGPEREAELARMLSGEQHDVALEHARTLLRKARS